MRRAWRSALIAVGLLVLIVAFYAWLVTSQAGAALMLAALEWQSSPAKPEAVREEAQAIVILTGQPSRVHAGARLHLATGVPIALVGKGGGERGFEAESEEMEDSLLRKYGIGPRWVENESRDTRENAVFAWCLLSSMGVRRIALVTHQNHMPRAKSRFESEGFDVIAAPVPDTEVMTKPPLTRASFVPSRLGIRQARGPLREWAGILFGPVERILDPPRACPYSGEPQRAP
jgi:uncharacterized SAM-binding protein YcdF (DUF218 family)